MTEPTHHIMWDPALNEIARMVEIRSRQKYQYDAANRLVQVKNDSDVTIASYTYGSSNERNH